MHSPDTCGQSCKYEHIGPSGLTTTAAAAAATAVALPLLAGAAGVAGAAAIAVAVVRTFDAWLTLAFCTATATCQSVEQHVLGLAMP